MKQNLTKSVQTEEDVIALEDFEQMKEINIQFSDQIDKAKNEL